ncbi:hypothetical protein ACFWBN_32085 [Streptomyces sp. NPDC059989]|uniref:hypothetical protein n=1 Tax=Streptomyces sp. NPDC059989 TaxID=3347026 RepID=UPI00368B43E7
MASLGRAVIGGAVVLPRLRPGEDGVAVLGGLISWGYDYSGDEHFFWSCDADPDRWKIVTNINGADPEVFAGAFTDFVIAFVKRLRDVDPHHRIDPDLLEFLELKDLNELAERGEIGPVKPRFGPF